MNFKGNISSDDINQVSSMNNPPAYEEGFEDSNSDSGFGGGDDLDDLFNLGGDDDDFGGFGDSSSSGGDDIFSGSGSSGGSSFGNDSFGGMNSGFGGMNSGFGGMNSGFGGMNSGMSPFGMNQGMNGGMNGAGQNQPKVDAFDKAMEAGADVSKSLWQIMVEIVNSLKVRHADDYGYLSRNLMVSGGVLSAVGLILGIAGTTTGVKFISFSGMGMQTMLGGALTLALGVTGIGISAFVLADKGPTADEPVEQVPEIPASEDNYVDDYEENLGEEVDDLFDGDFDLNFNDLDDEEDDFFNGGSDDEQDTFSADLNDIEQAPIDFAAELENIQENSVISRETLFNTFRPMLPTCTPTFSDSHEIDPDSEDFLYMQTICLKALSNLANIPLNEVQSKLESVTETFFSYELRLKRINKVKKELDLAREIEVYMRDNAEDDAVNASVSIEGDFYKIVVTKGVTAVITLGDIFRKEHCRDFFINTKNKLPVVIGIDELGNVLLEDAKVFDTMLITGKPRSGKSWYVLSILICLMLFNSPEEIQMCIIDPKESNLFKTISLLPHVFGLHNDEHVLNILNDIITVEGPRRKKLLSDHRCDDIWALRKKGVILPLLYVVMDEFITIKNNLDSDDQKDLTLKMQTLISQLPSLGIRLIFISHRATGIVDKTNRTMIQLCASVKGDADDVKETLGIQKWERALVLPGDIALKASTMKSAKYARGTALTPDDGDNTIFIETAAKAFYKMGVDIPDMSHLRIAYNRDAEYIKSELGSDSIREQFSADSVLSSLA